MRYKERRCVVNDVHSSMLDGKRKTRSLVINAPAQLEPRCRLLWHRHLQYSIHSSLSHPIALYAARAASSLAPCFVLPVPVPISSLSTFGCRRVKTSILCLKTEIKLTETPHTPITCVCGPDKLVYIDHIKFFLTGLFVEALQVAKSWTIYPRW